MYIQLHGVSSSKSEGRGDGFREGCGSVCGTDGVEKEGFGSKIASSIPKQIARVQTFTLLPSYLTK